MTDPGFIIHVQDGQHFYYLANNGAPYGQRQGPFPDDDATATAAMAFRRVISGHRLRHGLRPSLTFARTVSAA